MENKVIAKEYVDKNYVHKDSEIIYAIEVLQSLLEKE